MKKLLAFVLSVCLIMGLMIPAMAEDDPFIGEWHLHVISDSESSIDLGTLGIIVDLTMNADGTAVMTGMTDDGEPTNGTWVIDQEAGNIVVTMNEDPATGTYNAEDDSLSLTAEEQTMLFTREAIELKTFAEVNEAAAKEDFDGTWECAYICYDEMVTTVTEETKDVMPVITIKDGVCTMTGGTLGVTGTDENGDNAPVEMEFEGGKLAVNEALDDETGISMSMSLLQDGMMEFDLVIGDFVMKLYYVRAEA